MYAKFDEDAHNGFVSSMFRRSKCYGQPDEHTDGTKKVLRYSHHNALRWDKTDAFTTATLYTKFRQNPSSGSGEDV